MSFTDVINNIVDAVYERERRIGYEFYCYALLGKGDGLGTFFVPNGRPREVYVRRSDTRELFTVYLQPGLIVPYRDGDPRIEGQEVRIGKAPNDNQYIIMDALSLAGKESVGNTSLAEEVIYQAFFTVLENIKTLRARPTDVLSNDITVDGPYWYSVPSTGKQEDFTTGNVGTAIQTAITALAAGDHQLGIVYLDKETNTLGLLLGPSSTPTLTVPSRGEFFEGDVKNFEVSEDWEAISVVYLYAGQLTVVEEDFYRNWELRSLFSKGIARPAEKIYLHATFNGLGSMMGGALGS